MRRFTRLTNAVQEGREPCLGGRALRHVLQFHPHSLKTPRLTGDGCRCVGSALGYVGYCGVIEADEAKSDRKRGSYKKRAAAAI